MATQPIGDRLISVEEYLSTAYEPDCEYDDGVIVERNLGEFEHSFLQALLATLFTVNMDNWGVFGTHRTARPDQAPQVSRSRCVRVARRFTAREDSHQSAANRPGDPVSRRHDSPRNGKGR